MMYDNTLGHKSKYIVLTYDIILPFLVILAVIAGVWLVLYSKIFTVKNIVCKLDYEDCVDSPAKAEIYKYLGANTIKLDTSEISRKLTAGDFTVREVEFHKILPSTLSVNMISIYPTVAIKPEGIENEWVVFDASYRCLGLRKQDPNVPVLVLSKLPQFRVGQALDDDGLKKALDFTSKVSREIYNAKTFSFNEDTFTIKLANGIEVLMTTSKEHEVQIRTLQAILADNTMIQGVRTIDVRFSKPVLKSN